MWLWTASKRKQIPIVTVLYRLFVSNGRYRVFDYALSGIRSSTHNVNRWPKPAMLWWVEFGCLHHDVHTQVCTHARTHAKGKHFGRQSLEQFVQNTLNFRATPLPNSDFELIASHFYCCYFYDNLFHMIELESIKLTN